jgi:ribosomal protein S18 acetylase RimI-like enzyme
MEITFKSKKFRDIPIEEIRRMKILCQRNTGEKLIGYPDHNVINIYRNKKLVGFTFISPESPEPHFSNEKEAVYIYNFLIDIKYRKYKLAMHLMNELKKEYAGLSLNLDIIDWNAHSRKFFEKNGFKHVGEYRNYKSFSFCPL